ncbi:MAG: hypothetical protein EHM71_11810 [Zetaproteobacteria bacterium]|nr:MAG: hypothetical protein EHM71_11810 [Zetaproteobacteria bacterium]
MPTIVRYTDTASPENRYPWRIVSPSHSSACCFLEMEEIGELHREARWECVYKRCRRCGFTVQMILREIRDDAEFARLRRLIQRSFRRPSPEW